MLQIAAVVLFSVSVVGVLIGFSMRTRVSPYHQRGARLLIASSTLLTIVVTATLVVLSSGRIRLSPGRALPGDFTPEKSVAFSSSRHVWPPPPLAQSDTSISPRE